MFLVSRVRVPERQITSAKAAVVAQSKEAKYSFDCIRFEFCSLVGGNIESTRRGAIRRKSTLYLILYHLLGRPLL